MAEPLSPEVLAEGRRQRADAVAYGKWPVILHADHPWAVWLNDHGDALLAAAEERNRLSREVTRLVMQSAVRRTVCASCGKGPATDAEIAIYRVNVKGIPGVFLCQWCRPETRADPASSQEDVTAALRVRLGEVVRALAAVVRCHDEGELMPCLPRCVEHGLASVLLASPDLAELLKGEQHGK